MSKLFYEKGVLLVIVSSILSACGGGGDGDGGVTISPVNNPNVAVGEVTAPKEVIVGVVDEGFTGNITPIKTYTVTKNKSLKEVPDNQASKDSNHGESMNEIIRSINPNAQFINIHSPVTGPVEAYEDIIPRLVELHPTVKIINASWGIKDVYDEDWAEISKFFINKDLFYGVRRKDLLVIKAAGNESYDQPSPDSFANMANSKNFEHMIVVSGSDKGKHYYVTNKCGLLEYWCVLAPTKFKDTVGSSNSAAYVSGVTAVVYSKYNWMTAKNLQETILGTATDIGEVGIDDESGWGIVNPQKAIKGYGGMFWNDVVLNIPNYTYSFDNDMSGDFGFTKRGRGILELTGKNTYKGNTFIEGGGIVLKNSNVSSFGIDRNGTLYSASDNATANHILNDGILNLQLNGLTLTGHFIQSKYAALIQNLGNTLKVNGVANLDGKLKLTGISSKHSSHGKYIPIVTATEVQNRFASIDAGNIVNVRDVQYAANSVYVDVDRVNLKIAKENKQIKYVGADETVNNLENALVKMDQRVAKGEELSAYDDKLFDDLNTKSLFSSINRYNNSIFVNSNDNINIHSVADNTHLINSLKNNKTSVWLNTVGDAVIHKMDSNSKVKTHQYSQAMGGLVSFDHLSIGAELNLARYNLKHSITGIDFENSLKTDKYGLNLGLYQYNQWANIYATLGYAHIKNKAEIETERNNFSGNQLTTSVGISKDFDQGTLNFQPKLELHYAHLQQNNFNNKYYAINNAKARQLTSLLGLDASYSVQDNIKLNAKLGVEHDLFRKNSMDVYYGNTVNYSDKSYLSKTRYGLGFGVDYSITDHFKLYSSYAFKGGKKWYKNSINLGLNYKF